MNCETGELRRLEKAAVFHNENVGFTPVPDHLQEEAVNELNGKNSVMVDMTKDSKLVNWAKVQNKLNKKAQKKRRKNARKSRQINRH